MAIEINGPSPFPAQAGGENAQAHASRGNVPTTRQADPLASQKDVQGPQEGPSPAADAVTLTTQAQEMRTLEEDIVSTSVIDGERVETVRAAIDAGRYEINPTRVAEKFIQFESSLGGA